MMKVSLISFAVGVVFTRTTPPATEAFQPPPTSSNNNKKILRFPPPKTTIKPLYSTSPPKDTTDNASKQSSSPSFDLDELKKNLPQDLKLPDLSSLDLEAIKDNVLSGEFGTRGEVYVAAQFALILCVALGGVPVVGDVFNVVAGPGLLLGGIGVAVTALTELGSSLSPWPVTNDQTELVTTGIFAKVRHPVYAGLLASCVGLSLVSGSATRLLLTIVLAYVLDIKADFEEKDLQQAFPDYKDYKKNVPGKFFPQEYIEKLPWKSKED